MSSDGSDQYHPVYLDTTPEILRSLGLIRLVNGKMPKRLAAPPPVVRILRSGPVLEKLPRKFREAVKPVETPIKPLKRRYLSPVKLDMSDRNMKYTVDMLVWVRLTDVLWWPGVVTEESHVEKRRKKYISVVASVKFNEKFSEVYNKDDIRPYGCPNKEKFITMGKNTLIGSHSQFFKLENFETAVYVFDQHQLTADAQQRANSERSADV